MLRKLLEKLALCTQTSIFRVEPNATFACWTKLRLQHVQTLQNGRILRQFAEAVCIPCRRTRHYVGLPFWAESRDTSNCVAIPHPDTFSRVGVAVRSKKLPLLRCPCRRICHRSLHNLDNPLSRSVSTQNHYTLCIHVIGELGTSQQALFERAWPATPSVKLSITSWSCLLLSLLTTFIRINAFTRRSCLTVTLLFRFLLCLFIILQSFFFKPTIVPNGWALRKNKKEKIRDDCYSWCYNWWVLNCERVKLINCLSW